MRRSCFKLLPFVLILLVSDVVGQERPDIVERKDYNRNFYIKVKIGTGNTDWRLHFPENVVDTSNRLKLPAQNKLKFKGKGNERYLGFSALFGFAWGKLGGGFESSRLSIDSLREEIDGQELHFSYHEEELGFNRFYIEYESTPFSLDDEGQFYFVINALAGTYILYPVEQDIVPKSSLFVMLGPQIDYTIQRWLTFYLSAAYEFRYFNTAEQFGSRQLVYNNYLNSFNLNLGLRFRIYHPESRRASPPEQRVD